MANLVRNILSSVWMISDREASNLRPVVESLVRGLSVDMSQYVVQSRTYGYSNSPNRDQDRTIVIEIKGVIMKYDYCGDMGMMSLERLIYRLADDESVSGVILDIDSGGGEATYLDHVAEALRYLRERKTLVAHFSGICASAAYYLASQCQEIYASSPLDECGSIGTLCGMNKPNPNNRSQYTLELIYSTKSPAKNKAYRDALDGDYTEFERVLDEYSTSFHENVLSGRPKVDQSAFDGRLVTSDEAKKLNLIDGVKRLDQVIADVMNKNK